MPNTILTAVFSGIGFVSYTKKVTQNMIYNVLGDFSNVIYLWYGSPLIILKLR